MSIFWFLASRWRQRQSLQQCVEVDMAVLKFVTVANELVYQVRIFVYEPGAHGHGVLSHWLWSENSEPGILLARLAPLRIPPW